MMRPGNENARHPYTAQIASVALISAAFTCSIMILNFQSGWNAIWMFLLPIVLGFLFNRDLERGAFMAMALVGVSVFTVMIVGWSLGGM